MDFFQKPKVLTIVIIGLLVLNFGTLAFLWFHRPQKQLMEYREIRKTPSPRGFLEGQLNFSEKQKDEAMKLREEHMKTMTALQDSLHSLKNTLFDLIAVTPTDTPRVNAVVQAIGAEQQQIELSTFYHFQKIRALCDDNQKQKFDKIMKEVENRMDMGPQGPMIERKMDIRRPPIDMKRGPREPEPPPGK
jgi:protein CpxP